MRKNVVRALTGAAAAAAAASVIALPAGPASASTWYGTVAKVRHEYCTGNLMAQKNDDGTFSVVANFTVTTSGEYHCHGWLDISSDGGSSWKGLIDYQEFSSYQGGVTGWHDDTNKLARVCVQKDGMNPAQCSSWW